MESCKFSTMETLICPSCKTVHVYNLYIFMYTRVGAYVSFLHCLMKIAYIYPYVPQRVSWE